MSLKEKTISGLIWTFAEQFATKGIGFIVQIILARILLPEEFGLIAMIIIFIGIGNSLVDSGMTQSIIRTINPDDRDYSSVFIINIIVSLFIYGLIYVGAPAIANFYGQEILINILRVYALTIVIQSFVTVQITRMTKEMNFRIQTIIQIPSIIIGGIIGIYLALNNWGVWALVYMALARTLISTIQYWFYTGWRPNLKLNRERLWTHFNFGYKLTISGVIHTIFTEIYSVVIGKFYSASELGLYSRANSFQLQLPNMITPTINKVTYPAFAEFQADNIKLKSIFRKMISLIYYFLTPLTICLYFLAEPLFITLFTEKWLPAVPYFKILCVVGLLKPLHVLNMNILKVKGRSDLYLRIEIIKKVILTIGVLLLLDNGILALLYFQVFYSFISLFLNSYYTSKFLQYSIFLQFYDILKLLAISILIGILINALITYFNFTNKHILNITLFITVYAGVYFGASIIFKLTQLKDSYLMIKNLTSNEK